MLLLLPAYINAKITLQREEKRNTKLGLHLQNSLKFKRSVEKALPEARVVFRRISSVRIENPCSSQQIVGRSYTPPSFQVPVAGFWRFFSDTERAGHDDQGTPIIGKTWVHGHVRHKDKASGPGPKIVYIKSSLALARRKLEQYRAQQAVDFPPKVEQSTSPPEQVPASSNVGLATAPQVIPVTVAPHHVFPLANSEMAGAYVYVLRCPAHGRDIYKVGYTDRDPEQRARELSRLTATPTPFLVVQAWAVSDGYQAEQAAHQALDSFRLDSSREFFQTTYSALRQALEGAIQSWVL